MPTTVLFLRHSVRGIPDKIKLTDGSTTPIQKFTNKPLPLYASPADTTADGNLSGVGWDLSKKLGKLLAKRYKNISIRANVGTDRTIDTAIAIARGASVSTVSIYNGPTDPLFFPALYYNYPLPKTALEEMQAKYQSNRVQIKKVSAAITETFGEPLPTETKITLDGITGLLNIIAKFSQHPNFSAFSDIDLGFTSKNRRLVSKGAVIHQGIMNIPVYTQQQCSNIAQYILEKLQKDDGTTTVLVGNDETISALASLLGYKFKTKGWPTQFVTANAGFVFTYENKVTVDFLGVTPSKKFQVNKVSEPISIADFKDLIEKSIDTAYLNLSEIDNTIEYRVC